MRSAKSLSSLVLVLSVSLFWTVTYAGGQSYSNDEDPNKKILKEGLLGAGVGAISASASGGKAGKGALIGAGTNVIGGALLDTLTSSPQPQQPQYVQPQYVQQQPVQYVQSSYPVQAQGGYVRQEAPVQYVQQPAYYQPPPPAEDPNKKILKQGLLGAGVGAISASASGGKAGKGALIGAGTNVIGGALLDTVFSGGSSQQQQPQPVYYQPAPQPYNQGYAQQGYVSQNSSGTAPKKKIIRHYDADGNVTSEEEVYE